MLPDDKTFELTSDKLGFQQFCEQQGLPVPESFTVEKVKNTTNSFVPLVVKPRSGQGSVGIYYIETPEQLSVLDTLEITKYVIQRRVSYSNNVVGAFFLCRGGKVVSAYTHQRLRTFPPEGGVTVYSKSGNQSELLQIGANLLRKLQWDGLAMIEFLFNEKARKWYIIELNPRVWGSVLLSAFNGTEMLRTYVELALGLPVNHSGAAKEVFIRWMYPFECLNLLKRHISFREFVSLRLKTTCYINMTYSTLYRSVLFLLYFSVNFSSIKRYIAKLKR